MPGLIDDFLATMNVGDEVSAEVMAPQNPAPSPEPQEVHQNAPNGGDKDISRSLYGEEFMRRYGR